MDFPCKKTMFLSNFSRSKLASFRRSCFGLLFSYFRVPNFRISPFWIQLLYFIIVSSAGYLALKVSKPRTAPFFKPTDLDLFFTSVSAVTVSSMSTVEMEVFSNTQLVILTILMFVGGEVFTSLLGLQLIRSNFTKNNGPENRLDSVSTDSESQHKPISLNLVEVGLVNRPQLEEEKPNTTIETGINAIGVDYLKYNSIKCLGYVVICYLLVLHLGGSILIYLYIVLVPSTREILKNRGIPILTFSVFATVSTFSNCGFIPTNENMMVFVKNSGLLLLLIPQVLLGNTLYAPCLRLVIWVLERVTKREEFSYLLKNYGVLGYGHLLSWLHSLCVAATVFGFVLVQFTLFCAMEWRSETMEGDLNSYQKLVGSLFQVVNSRHAGEFVVDLSTISPAILVLFIVMMYLPSYTSFLLTDDGAKASRNEKKNTRIRKKFADYVLFSHLSYIVVFVILICITEREKMEEDPLNFSVLNITLEVVSAYGNVGFSSGYSCKRRLKYSPDSNNYCKDAWYGFGGRWSKMGKLVLILVMFFGRVTKSTTLPRKKLHAW